MGPPTIPDEMSRGLQLAAWASVAAWGMSGAARAEAGDAGTAPSAAPYCTGEYADDFAVLSAQASELDHQPQSQYSYCIRNTATYECLSYGAEGNVRRTRRKVVLHGTGFGYRLQNGETYLLTNDHVAEWPGVTDEDHPVDDVPPGCKKVGETLRIVDNENDEYERDDIPLTRMVGDPQLDVAVLKAPVPLNVLPWKIGRSASLKARNVVEVRGFPLGAFRATNVGKVISAYDHDDYKDYDHVDFVIDALLSQGNSGSPVLAVSCRTGEFELVGVYHARYTRGTALHVVVGIDQVRDLMTTLKRTPRALALDTRPLDANDRVHLFDSARRASEPFFPLGPLPAAVRARPDGALIFEVFSKDFPMKAAPILVLEDLPAAAPTSFGDLGRIWFGGPQGLKAYAQGDLDADTLTQIGRMLDALRHDASVSFAYRDATRDAISSRQRFDDATKLEKRLTKVGALRRDLAQGASDLADRYGPKASDAVVTVADAMAVPPAPAARPPPADVALRGSGAAAAKPAATR